MSDPSSAKTETPPGAKSAGTAPEKVGEKASEKNPEKAPDTAGATAPQDEPAPAKPRPDHTRYGDWEKNGRCIDF